MDMKMNDRIKILANEADIEVLRTVAQNVGHDLDDIVEIQVKPAETIKSGEKIVADPENLRYASQIANKTMDDLAAMRLHEVSHIVPKTDGDTDAFREWKTMMDDISQRVSGTFAAVNYQMIDQFARGDKKNSDEVGEFRPIDIDNLDNVPSDVLSEVSEMDEMFLEQKDNGDSTKEFRR